ncbi:MAG: enoyl-CoA hydratase-related protein [Rhodobacterales bacterium]|jgi:2-(1,2-epoxy-1,2-dihydrophenyl)acetyl-CoA isomerase|nr:2-(1,2-epoxy-1,2-dihydrophenyl)acetyl-CoA isomerase [Paracoccaceae bacterium]
MSYQTITFNVVDGVATLALNRPEVLNGLTAGMRAEIRDAVLDAPNHGRVLVITGNGRAFCSGQDLGGSTAMTDLDLGIALREEYEPMLRAIYDCPIPTISAVNGVAAGAGANLALAADVVIASESAYFLQAFALIGLIPDAGGTYFLPRNMGFAKAMGASLFADRIPAQQASDWGLIYEAVADADFVAHIAKRAASLAKGPTAGYKLIKQAVRASFGNDLDAQLTLEADLQTEAGKTVDFVEGVSAFNEKRKPKFIGR